MKYVAGSFIAIVECLKNDSLPTHTQEKKKIWRNIKACAKLCGQVMKNYKKRSSDAYLKSFSKQPKLKTWTHLLGLQE